MPRLLLRLAFDGSRYAGSQRNPGQVTVDGELLRTLGKAGMLATDPRLRPAGRLDARVSARDYPVALDVEGATLDQVALAVAGGTRGIVPWAGREVEDGFDPRRAARSRTYTYHWPRSPDVGEAGVAQAWKAFEGRHDFSSFAKRDPERDPVRTILATELALDSRWLVFEVTGQAFLWNQVRRMVGAALDVGAGRLDLEEVEAALAGRPLRVHSKAAPEGLVLSRVDLPVETPALPEAATLGRSRLAADRGALQQRLRVLDVLHERT